MSEYLFGRACVGDLLQVSGPFGTFGLRDETASDIIFIATGTGIAPILSILGFHQNALESKSVSVYWGGRHSNDIYAPIEKIPCVDSFRPVLSREHKDSYLAGYVQDAVLNDVANFSNTSVYACGSPHMIKDCRDALVSKGLESGRFYSDAFVESSKESEL